MKEKIYEILKKYFIEDEIFENEDKNNTEWDFYLESCLHYISVDPELSDEEYERRNNELQVGDSFHFIKNTYKNFKTLEELDSWCSNMASYMYMSEDFLFGWFREELIHYCMTSPFPGSVKYEADHPIWNCRIAKAVTPKEAWKDYKLMSKAVDNLLWIVNKSIKENKYADFVERIQNACEEGGVKLLREVLLRFTVAKIAPKVTALAPSTLYDIIDKSGIDLSNGVYCPMAGFGGIIRGTERWFAKHHKKPEIEAFDINPNLCKYFGWTEKDVLSDYVETDKVVIACPPFGENTERWEGTPDNMYYEFHDWCKLIKEHIKAPNYILIGPEITDESRKRLSGLFQKKLGIQWYPEYSILNEE